MSWFWGKDKDATSGLDSGLKDFLKDESKRQQQHEEQTKRQQPESPSYRSQVGLASPTPTNPPQAEHDAAQSTARVPPQSHFQDGRYAHLWKTYRSPEDLAAATMTDQDRMKAVLDNYSDRKAAVGRAAIENCIVEQLAQRHCFMHGSWSQLATMCRAEGKAFNRCYEMQSRFLKALGYLSQPRSEEEEERIQMHADKLYHKMLEQERRAKEDAATQSGSVKAQTPLINPEETTKALGEDSAWHQIRQEAAAKGENVQLSQFSASQRRQIVERLKDMNEHERALELQLLAAEKRVDRDLAQQLMDIQDEESRARAVRRAQGKETFTDSIKRYWGWDR